MLTIQKIVENELEKKGYISHNRSVTKQMSYYDMNASVEQNGLKFISRLSCEPYNVCVLFYRFDQYQFSSILNIVHNLP